jgi:hypothetical protein
VAERFLQQDGQLDVAGWPRSAGHDEGVELDRAGGQQCPVDGFLAGAAAQDAADGGDDEDGPAEFGSGLAEVADAGQVGAGAGSVSGSRRPCAVVRKSPASSSTAVGDPAATAEAWEFLPLWLDEAIFPPVTEGAGDGFTCCRLYTGLAGSSRLVPQVTGCGGLCPDRVRWVFAAAPTGET